MIITAKITRTQEEDYVTKRERAQKITEAYFQRLSDEGILTRSPRSNVSKTFVQYTREELDSYTESPLNNIDNIREISRFLTRVSMPYKLLLQYYASMYEYRYNITPISDYSKAFKSNVMKQY